MGYNDCKKCGRLISRYSMDRENDKDVVRHSLVQKIVNAYERLEKSIEKPR